MSSFLFFIKKHNYGIGIFLERSYVITIKMVSISLLISTQSFISATFALVDLMENLFFLVTAAILLAVSVYFLISYLKDRKRTKLSFNKRK